MPQEINDSATRVDAPEARETAGPIRQCCVTRERLNQDQLIRFVRAPDGNAVPDATAKLPGRGAWVTASRSYVEAAIASGALSRAFKSKTALDDDVLMVIETQLAMRCIGLIGMAKKSGQIIRGFDQVRAILRKQPPGWILTARDSAEDSRSKVHFLAQALYGEVNTAGALTSAELGMAFGREHVIHAVLSKGRLAESFGIAYRRLTGFRSRPETHWFSDETTRIATARDNAEQKG